MVAGKVTGGCLCGAVRYEIEGEPIMAGHCCCHDCQKASGAGHGTAAGYPSSKISITGDVKGFTKIADSGGEVTRYFCPQCGGRLFGESTAMAGMKTVMIGTMDDPGAAEPQMVIFAKSRHDWDTFDEALPRFDHMPPMGDGP